MHVRLLLRFRFFHGLRRCRCGVQGGTKVVGYECDIAHFGRGHLLSKQSREKQRLLKLCVFELLCELQTLLFLLLELLLEVFNLKGVSEEI